MLPVICAALSFLTPINFKVSGWITDDNGNAVPFATILEKGTKNAVVTDAKGYYSINISNKKATLEISAAGFNTQSIQVKGRALLNIVLSNSKDELQEVVVTAAGIKRKQLNYSESKLVGSVPGMAVQYDKFYEPDSEGFNTEGYNNITENIFLKAVDNPLSTFSIDVDAASYSNVRRMLKAGQLPPAGAVRVEEMINYFQYNYPPPTNEHPFSFTTEMSDAPWNPNHKLVMIGMQGKKIPTEHLPASNLVFLIDVSGSMESANKLGLVKSSLKLLTDQLREQDKVSIVVYAGAAGLVLKPTSGADKTTIKDALEKLNAGGSTAGGQGIQLAYKTAREYFAKDGNNRVILCTDGDFNVGASSDDDMVRLIEKERNSGIFLTVLGYGMGNYKDNKMQKLANKGNGNHAYIDDITEAKKVLVNEFGGTLFTIAKDVKLQVEFNPAKVQGYRLVGYENRMLNKEDFNDDKKDAGELGSGHSVTAIYEIIPVGVKSSFLKDVDKLKYSSENKKLSKSSFKDEIMTIKFRYKAPDSDISKLIEHPVKDNGVKITNTSANFRFAAAVAQFGMLLRNSEFKKNASYHSVIELAKNALGNDAEGYRKEFVTLVETAESLATHSKNGKEDLAGNE